MARRVAGLRASSAFVKLSLATAASLSTRLPRMATKRSIAAGPLARRRRGKYASPAASTVTTSPSDIALLTACGGNTARAVFRFIRAEYHAKTAMSLYVMFPYR